MIKRFVITGGPSTGKSSIIKHLENQGYQCFKEISRKIIRKRGIISTEKDLSFEIEVFNQRKEQYGLAKKLHFYDRSMIDVLAYMKINKIEPPRFINEYLKSHRYENTVFIAKPWEHIYKTDKERVENYEQSKEIYANLKTAYKELNYELIDLPLSSIEDRVNYILSKIGLII